MVHNDRIVFIDFGTAKLVPFDHRTGSRMLIRQEKIIFGRLVNLPFESLSELAFDGYSVDLWAVMITFYRLVTGQLPWECARITNDLFKSTCLGGMKKSLEESDLDLSPDLIDLLDKFFKFDPRKRLGLAEILRHPWFS